MNKNSMNNLIYNIGKNRTETTDALSEIRKRSYTMK
jgi:hypothetical protein